MSEAIDNICELSTGKKLAILFGSLGLVAVIFWIYFMGPVAEEVALESENIEALRLQVSKSKGIAKNLDKYKEEVERLDIELQKALRELPDKKAIAGLLSKISDKAKDSGLEVSLFKPQGEQKKDFYAEVPVEMKVRGTYHQVATFFDEVGRMSRIVNLANFEMKAPDLSEEESAVVLDTSVVATTFRFLEESEREELDEKRSKGKKKKKA